MHRTKHGLIKISRISSHKHFGVVQFFGKVKHQAHVGKRIQDLTIPVMLKFYGKILKA